LRAAVGKKEKRLSLLPPSNHCQTAVTKNPSGLSVVMGTQETTENSRKEKKKKQTNVS
jgi:hypothetical protein